MQSGGWDDVSGETFLRNLLSMPLEHAKWTTVSPLISGVDNLLGSMHQHAAPLTGASHCQFAVSFTGSCMCSKLNSHAPRLQLGFGPDKHAFVSTTQKEPAVHAIRCCICMKLATASTSGQK